MACLAGTHAEGKVRQGTYRYAEKYSEKKLKAVNINCNHKQNRKKTTSNDYLKTSHNSPTDNKN